MKCFKRLRNSVVAIVHSWWRIAGSHAHLVVVGNRLAVLEEDRGKLVESHVGSREELFDGAVEGFHIVVGAGLWVEPGPCGRTERTTEPGRVEIHLAETGDAGVSAVSLDEALIVVIFQVNGDMAKGDKRADGFTKSGIVAVIHCITQMTNLTIDSLGEMEVAALDGESPALIYFGT